jgi:hypothetical protein
MPFTDAGRKGGVPYASCGTLPFSGSYDVPEGSAGSAGGSHIEVEK